VPNIGERRAVIDVGSNSLLLVVAEWNGSEWIEKAETSEVTALGKDTKRTGILSESSMQRSLDALRNAWRHAESLNAKPHAFATMAARIASNSEEFMERANRQGTPVEILSAEDEARLGLLSVCNDPKFASNNPITIIDVGGHSTEISTMHNNAPVFQRSFAVGTLGLASLPADQFVCDGPDLLRASKEIDDKLGFRYLKDRVGTVVALGASATNLISIRDEITPWNPKRVHGAYLDFEEISKFAAALARMTIEERAKLPGIEPGREFTIHIGALILERSLQAVHALGCYVSTKGWRHAMLDFV
jgi:exopolyphosphatase/guanosine-5'-triphosphate,3'-diphosphate pyrophosphatase